MGAAGRDYHLFNEKYRSNSLAEVVCFTHAQIPHIASSMYPPELSGPLYPKGIPIFPESKLDALIKEHQIDTAVLAYSDLAMVDVTKLSSRVRAAGANMLLLGNNEGMLASKKPVVAVTAVRTGCGKSQLCRLVIDAARKLNKKVVLVRHPMPYGDLAKQAVQRPAHQVLYYPGDVNFRCADIIVINKANTAPPEAVEAVQRSARELNPTARVFVTASEVFVDKPELVKGKRVLCVEDGPTTTHGGMATGAAVVAAQKYGAAEVVNPHPYFVGELQTTLLKYPHIGKVVPAMGYSDQQLKDLQATIAAVPCDVVLLGTPHDITRLIPVPQPLAVVTYRVVELEPGNGIMSLAAADGAVVCAVDAIPADEGRADAEKAALKETLAAGGSLQECLEKVMQEMK
eukprot:gene1966-2293_t